MLRQKLQEQGVTDSIPEGKVELLIRRADADADGHLDYNEFCNMVSYALLWILLNSMILYGLEIMIMNHKHISYILCRYRLRNMFCWYLLMTNY